MYVCVYANYVHTGIIQEPRCVRASGGVHYALERSNDLEALHIHETEASPQPSQPWDFLIAAACVFARVDE